MRPRAGIRRSSECKLKETIRKGIMNENHALDTRDCSIHEECTGPPRVGTVCPEYLPFLRVLRGGES